MLVEVIYSRSYTTLVQQYCTLCENQFSAERSSQGTKRHNKIQGFSAGLDTQLAKFRVFYEAFLRLALTDGFTVLEIAADTVANKAFSMEHLSAEGYF